MELQNIAYALGLDIDGRVEDIKSEINTYFDKHEPLRTSPCYIGLFPQLARQAHWQVAQTTSTLSHSVRNITNTQLSSDQHNHIVKDHQFTLDARNQQYSRAQEHILSHPGSSTSTYRPPGPLNWPLGLVPPSYAYIVHNLPYYNVNSNTSS